MRAISFSIYQVGEKKEEFSVFSFGLNETKRMFNKVISTFIEINKLILKNV
jgi:hypothetical protein